MAPTAMTGKPGQDLCAASILRLCADLPLGSQVSLTDSRIGSCSTVETLV